MSLRIVEAPADGVAWDAFVASMPSSTFCHQYGWKRIMKDVLGHESLYLVALNDRSEWKGVLPLVRVKTILGHHLISVPFLNDGGPLGDGDAQQALTEFAVTEARRSGATLVELRSRLDVIGPVTPSNRKIGVRLELPPSVEDLWSKTFRAKLRSQIRRPLKEGMIVRSGADELPMFHRIFAQNMRDLGTPVLPVEFFERIAKEFSNKVIFSTVYTSGGQPAAAACCLMWRDELEVVWASSLRKLNHLSPNMLLYSSLMEEAIKRGVSVFNFGRSTRGAPTHRFKQQWGGTDVPLSWPRWPAETSQGIPQPDQPLFRVATSIWRHLPIAVANRIGPSLARMLP